MKALDKKAVVITGAGQGLGAAYAKHAAAEGARVVVNDIDAKLVDAVVKAIRDAGYDVRRIEGPSAAGSGAPATTN